MINAVLSGDMPRSSVLALVLGLILVCLALAPFLFPGVRVVGSVAVARIEGEDRALGLLAVGSSNAGHYDSSMGTLFLNYIGEVLSRVIYRLHQRDR